MKLLSYTAIDGIPTFTDSFVMGLFQRMMDEDLVGRVFFDGSAKSPEDFLKLMKHGPNSLFVIDLETDKMDLRGQIGGVCWLNGFGAKKAEFHFCFFSNLRGDKAVEIGKEVVTELLYMEDAAGNPIFDMLYGMTEVSNVPADKWCEAMGFDLLGALPSGLWNAELQKSVPARFWYVERGHYGRR